MTSAAPVLPALALAGALLVAGGRPAAGRLRALDRPPPQAPGPTPVLRPSWTAVGAAASGLIGWTVAGPVAAVVLACAAAGAGAIALRRTTAGAGPAPEPPGDLAAAWELLAVCLEAGLPVASAVSAAAEPLDGAVGARLRRVAGLLELGADPAAAWHSAEEVPALAGFARAAGRSAATGSALASAARAEGSRIRAGLVDDSQAAAQRAAVLVTGPLGLCFLPAFLALGIAPVVVGLAGQALAQW